MYHNKFKCLLLGSSILVTSLNAAALSKGADISWLSEMEDSGYQFYNDSGRQQDVLTILKDHGMDSIRLRVWVDPEDPRYNSLEDVIAKAKRAKNAGMKIMIDFHYSDTWADPGNQNKPSAWQNYSFQGLMDSVWWHTHSSLTALKSAGITPTWVQVGNETNNGMLWNDGLASSNMKNYAWLVNSGYNAVKEIFPQAKVVIHLANCHDNANFRWIFDGLKNNGSKWDVIGASSYPKNAPGLSWQEANKRCLNNLTDMVARYNTDVMISEVGVPWDDQQAKSIVSDIINKVKSINNNRGIGIFYWEPQAYNWKGYSLGAWNPNTGRPTSTLDAFIP